MKIDVTRETEVSGSSRVRQLEGLFDVPRQERQTLHWTGELNIDRDWQIGAFIGASGSGKSTLLHELFGDPLQPEWGAASVIDDFDPALSMVEISETCGAVGFNTIPAWMRPHRVLSNGEQFRADLARRLLEAPTPILIDEFTSVVDRQVAQIGAYAVAKRIRKSDKQLVVATCHADVVDWLEPDWIFDPALMQLQWRRLRGRPAIDVVISPVHRSAWRLFSPYHYLNPGPINPSAQCYVAFVNGRPASFCAILHHPHASVRNLKRFSRGVTLPDWQGLGLAMHLHNVVASAYKARGWRVRNVPAHPAWVRVHDRSPNWAMTHRPGYFGPKPGASSPLRNPGAGGRSKRLGRSRKGASGLGAPHRSENTGSDPHMNPGRKPTMSGWRAGKNVVRAEGERKPWVQGSRPNAVFEFVGEGNKEYADVLRVAHMT